MSARHDPARFRAYRHLFTSAGGGTLGGPGFQTVAAAAALEPLLDKLERQVGYFALPAGEPAFPTLQLRQWDEHFHLLTRYQLLASDAEGRTGNYLAESLLVSTDWLAGGEWDADAAFDAVEWWGPERLESLPDEPMALPEERLAALAPGPLDRLARLAERAPGDLLDHLLLGAVAWAVRGERMVVVEGRPERPEEVATVVRLLPLALPPCSRSTARGGPRRGIEIRTRGPARGMSAVDLAGVVADDLDAVATNGGTVIDLGGRLGADPRPDLDGYDYVQWAKKALRAGRWQEIAEVYRRCEEVPGEALFRRFDELRKGWTGTSAGAASGRSGTSTARPTAVRPPPAESPAAAPRRGGREAPPHPPPPADDLPGDALPGVLEERREEWRARRSLESAVGRGHDALRGELDALLGALDAANARALERLREQVSAAADELSERLRAEHEELWAKTRRQLEALALESQHRLHDDVDTALRRVRKESETLLRGMRREAEERERELEATGAAVEGHRKSSPRAAMARLRASARRRPLAWGAAAVSLVALLAWGGWTLWRPAPREDGAGADAAAAAPGRGELLARLGEGPVVRSLLLRARGDEALREPAAATALALLLGEAPIGEDTSCLLLQAALRRRGLPAGRPLTVDGDCGPGTWGTLSDAIGGSCCAEIPLPAEGVPVERRSCFLATVFTLPEAESCGGDDPLATDRPWSVEEAGRVLALARFGRESAGEAVQARARELVDRLDLTASAAVAERAAELPVDAAETELLLALARRLAAGRAGGTADDAAVASFLRDLSTGPAPAAETDEAPVGGES